MWCKNRLKLKTCWYSNYLYYWGGKWDRKQKWGRCWGLLRNKPRSEQSLLCGGWKSSKERWSRGVLMKPSRDMWKEHLLFSSYESWDSMWRRWCRSERVTGRHAAFIPVGDPVRAVWRLKSSGLEEFTCSNPCQYNTNSASVWLSFLTWAMCATTEKQQMFPCCWTAFTSNWCLSHWTQLHQVVRAWGGNIVAKHFLCQINVLAYLTK